jgi:hypothetical protein
MIWFSNSQWDDSRILIAYNCWQLAIVKLSHLAVVIYDKELVQNEFLVMCRRKVYTGNYIYKWNSCPFNSLMMIYNQTPTVFRLLYLLD